MIDRFGQIDRTRLSISSIGEPPDDVAYWRTRTYEERLIGIELLRWMNHGPAASAERLRRTLEIAER